MSGAGIADVRAVQMDNTLNPFVSASDPDDAADLTLDTLGACRVPRGPVTGRFVARVRHFYSWAIDVVGGPGTPIPLTFPVPISNQTQTTFGGAQFTIDLSALDPCGYVVRLAVVDRAVLGSASFGRAVYVERGLCLE